MLGYDDRAFKGDQVSAESSGEITAKKICVACNSEYTHGEIVCPHDGTALTTIQKDSLIGQVLGGRYEIEERIGSGAMGEVYKAKHRLMKRQVAIKMMHPQTISGASALKRFQKEAEMASALNHPNVLTVHDFGVSDDGSPYLVMNFLEGKSLNEVIEHSGHLEVPRALHIFRQLCQGLGHAHEKGVIHRDLKPSNVMLVTLDQDPDFVQILDFGIAKQLTPEASSDSLTRTGEVFGSPHYMSPEQCRALPVDARSDIYALGCVMYRVLTGKPPLMGGDLVECLYKHVNEMPASFADLCPDYNLPSDLEAVIFKAVAKKPEDRYQTMAEMKNALESLSSFQTDSANKTYGSLAGIKPGVTLTSLPASVILSSGNTVSGENAPGTNTGTNADTNTNQAGAQQAGEISVDNSAVVNVGGNQIKPSQTGDLPALQTAMAKEDSKADAKPTAAPSPAPLADQGAEVSAAAANPHANTAAPPVTVSVSAPPVPVKKGLPFSPKLFVVAGIPVALIVITLMMTMLNPSTVADKSAALRKEAQDNFDKGNYGKAEQLVRAAINAERIKNQSVGEESTFLLGTIQCAEADYSNSKSSLETALKLTKAKQGADSKEAAEVEITLGKVLTALGQYPKAEEVLQSSYQTRKKLFGDGTPLVADSLAGLAYLHQCQRSYSKAISEFTSALHMVQDAKGEDSPDAANALCNLGQAYQLSHMSPQAEALYKQALDIRKKSLGANSPYIADSYERLAYLYSSNGNLVQAKNCFEQALAIESKSLDSASPRLAVTRQALADLNNRLSGRHRR